VILFNSGFYPCTKLPLFFHRAIHTLNKKPEGGEGLEPKSGGELAPDFDSTFGG